jgi:CHAT domain-containing protein
MTRFNLYLQSGMTAAAALTWAQRDLIARKFTTTSAIRGVRTVSFDQEMLKTLQTRDQNTALSPFFWAPFILVGSTQ